MDENVDQVELGKAAGEGNEGVVKGAEDKVNVGSAQLFLVISEDDTP